MLIQSEHSDGELSAVGSCRDTDCGSRTRKSERNNSKCSRARTNQRSLNSVLCGCLSPRSSCATSSEQPSVNMNVQLLPSSALQSMRRLSISCHGDTAPDALVDKKRSGNTGSPHLSSENSAVLTPSRVHLPSSAIITHALLSKSRSTDSGSGKNSRSSGRVVTRQPLWKNFRMRRKKDGSMCSSRYGKGSSSVDSDSSMNNVPSTLSVADDAEVNEALVFSPLPSQAIPEPTTTTHHAALLGPRSESDKGKKCFVIDLDETLVHSSFKMVEQADFKVGVEIDGITHRVYVLKRPHVDAFLSTMANLYECVLFTASLAKYADPVADFIDKWNAFRYRLFRESCVYHRGNYVKDLSHLGRPINQIVILDNSPASYMFHASHAVQISSWFDDANDRALLDLIPYFERLASHPNVVDFLRTNTPPTPYAAVGTVGLPSAALPNLPASDVAGRSTDSGAIISSIRRPTVASPLPVTLHESRIGQQRREIPTVTTTTSTVAEPRRVQPQGIVTNQRLPGASSIPVITKVATPSGGTLPSRRPGDQDPSVSFPAPLSLATYVPVPSPPSPAVVISNSTSGSAAQTRVGDAANNSHNLPGVAARNSFSSNSSVSAANFLSSGVVERPESGPPEPSKRVVHRHPVKPVCSSSGENHHVSLDNAPRRLGTVKSLPSATQPLRTSSPPLSVTPNPVSTRRIYP